MVNRDSIHHPCYYTFSLLVATHTLTVTASLWEENVLIDK
uniref:Uncharacterized protein n=1 Tax=Arundo donax TaxID=35708 RepID=A0A0A8Z020_ARUDO